MSDGPVAFVPATAVGLNPNVVGGCRGETGGLIVGDRDRDGCRCGEIVSSVIFESPFAGVAGIPVHSETPRLKIRTGHVVRCGAGRWCGELTCDIRTYAIGTTDGFHPHIVEGFGREAGEFLLVG